MEPMKFMLNHMANAEQKQELEKRFDEFYSGKLDDTGLDVTEDREKDSSRRCQPNHHQHGAYCGC